MGNFKEAIQFTHELAAHVVNRHLEDKPAEEIDEDIKTVNRVISIQAKHLENSSAALIKQAEQLINPSKSDQNEK